MARELYAGVMSGTSLDGVDAVVAEFGVARKACETLGAAHIAFPTLLRDELLALQQPGNNELARAGAAATMLAEMYADAIGRVGQERQHLHQHVVGAVVGMAADQDADTRVAQDQLDVDLGRGGRLACARRTLDQQGLTIVQTERQ